MAIKTNGTLWGWGNNLSGRMGTGNTTSTSSPVQIGTLSDWAKISCGSNATFAIKTDGTLWAWGNNNIGQLGDGTFINKSSPIQIGTLSNWNTVSANDATSVVATKTDGTLWGWGANEIGQLGIGNTTNRSSPVQIGSLTSWSSGSCASSHSLFLTT
jgi:alpha-tubulin suppressor-like RCC1 family protein